MGRFRNLLIRNNLQEKMFAQVIELLAQRGLILKKGAIIDSTFIESPSSTKNQKKQRDPEGSFREKVKATVANVHDVTVTSDLLTGEEEAVYGDSGYLGADKQPESLKKNKT